MLNIVLITSNELRHDYFRLSLCNNKKFKVLYSIIEENDNSKQYVENNNNNQLIKEYLITRNHYEKDFFSDYVSSLNSQNKNKIIKIKKNQINCNKIYKYINKNRPDIIVTFGCSIIKKKLISLMKNKIINIHLGLSPYYLGSSTNYHALVNGDFHLVGYTFMYLDSGIDTGEIIHQGRPDIYIGDNSHQIGNRTIIKMVNEIKLLLINFKKIKRKKQISNVDSKIFKKKDFTLKSLLKLFNNLYNLKKAKRLIKKKLKAEKQYKIISQNFKAK
tara:strand:+ start:1293 stop:2114 length:822 start_codon:yes stop_codon:yes gene_type:complete